MAEDTNNTGQAFSTGNFSNVDDIMSIIDSKKEESVNNDPDEVRNIDMQDNGIEYGDMQLICEAYQVERCFRNV